MNLLKTIKAKKRKVYRRLLSRLEFEQNRLSNLLSARTFKYQKIMNSVNNAIEILVPDVSI